MSLHDDLIDPDAQVVDIDEEAYYDNNGQDEESVVVVEPKIVTIGRKIQRDNLRDMQNGDGNS